MNSSLFDQYKLNSGEFEKRQAETWKPGERFGTKKRIDSSILKFN